MEDYAMKRRWPMALLILTGGMLAAGALQALSLYVSGGLYDGLLWAGVPLAALVLSARAVRRGLNNYLAWLPPPVCLGAAHALIWGYPPAPGAILLTAFTALVGAAAGEVLVQREKRK